MFSSLSSTLDGCQIVMETGSLHYIIETPDTSANHLTTYYLIDALKDRSVCFVALQNSWTHYCTIGNKLGINLKGKVDEKTLAFLDGFKELASLVFGEESESEHNIFSHIGDPSEGLRKLYLFIKAQVDSFNPINQFTIIIDSLTPLLNLYYDINMIDTFVQYCSQLTKTNGFLVVSSVVSVNDRDSVLLSHLMLRKCSVNFSVKGLSTGLSKDIDGEITIRCFSQLPHRKILTEKVFHFKVEERDVKIFERGLARHVL